MLEDRKAAITPVYVKCSSLGYCWCPNTKDGNSNSNARRSYIGLTRDVGVSTYLTKQIKFCVAGECKPEGMYFYILEIV